MIVGQYSLVNQMNTSNLITMQTLNFFGALRNMPLRELFILIFPTLISHFVFWHVKLEDTKCLPLERIWVA